MNNQIIDVKDLFRKIPILSTIDLKLCVDCKSVKLLCGLNRCPLVVDQLDIKSKIKNRIDDISRQNTIFGPTPQIFVGDYGYPDVFTGPMTSLFPDDSLTTHTKPSDWVDLPINSIVDLRFGLLRGKQRTQVKYRDNPHFSSIQDKLKELTLSIKPVEIEGNFLKKPQFEPILNPQTQPMGPSGLLKHFTLTSNPKIPKLVDYLLEDEISASLQLTTLNSNKYDIYYLQNIFSAGVTGVSERSKIVPTKWSITAVDDILGKDYIQQLRDFSTIRDVEVLQNNLLGNYFTVCLIPGDWQFENFETWLSGTIYTISNPSHIKSVNREGFVTKEKYKGRTSYASQAGGYYASRLSILEHLINQRRQARVLIFREVTPEYKIPVGVWVVREGVRKTMKSPSLKFSDKNQLISWLQSNLKLQLKEYFSNSEILSQNSLLDFFS